MRPLIAHSQELLIAYARDALQILMTSLDLSRRGRPEFYRVAALQLRLLLCDTTRRHGQISNVSLLPRLLPNLRLAPLGPDGIFDSQAPPLTLDVWLEQPLPATLLHSPIPLPSGLTIRYLIRWVCEQDGGAHVDPRRLSVNGLPKVSNRPGPDYSSQILFIAEYIASLLETQIALL
ncbi:MAG TPA: hypothetical protein VKF38_13050 [Anaerolineaceae bacterium]|nr:hypothetical protein [Anaerolineaceae bacterium]